MQIPLIRAGRVQEGNSLQVEIGDGLILRRGKPADAEKLSAFNARIHSDLGPDHPDERVSVWSHDLLTRPHPTFQPGDFTIIEKAATGEIVSSMNLISQTWSYAGIPFGVGRPELVGTLPEYRHRGLIRAQFEVIHRWSAERGEKVQAITGIPYYYRIFGYEMCLDLGGGRSGSKNTEQLFRHVPRLSEGQAEPYTIRPALEADLPFIGELYDQGRKRWAVGCIWNQDLWRYELTIKNPKNVNRVELRIIEAAPTGDSDPRVGFLAHPAWTWGPMQVATAYELKPGISWAAVTPCVVRYLVTTGETYASQDNRPGGLTSFGLWFGAEHPVYEVMKFGLPQVRTPYAWYLRVPDLIGFLQQIAPALEQRLADSPLVGHSGEVKLTFYSNGLRMIFEHGRLNQIENWTPTPVGHSGDAAFPGLTFLQLLFSYRSLDELRHAFPDCWQDNDTVYALLKALFPKQPSNVWPIS